MALASSQRRRWTIDDLKAIPDDGKRYELIEGEVVEMTAPNMAHAMIVANLLRLLFPLLSTIGLRALTAPVNVFLRGKDLLQPDVAGLLPGSRARMTRDGIDGPPDLVIEVLSPSNRVHDLLTKRALYELAGVREYWIVDPDERTVEILTLHEDALHRASLATAAGDDLLVSPLLPGADLPLAAVFAGIDDIAE